MIVKELGLVNSVFSMILPIGIHMFNMLVIKSFFQQIPSSLREAAMIDGANEIKICFKVILPLAKPVLATFSLYYAVFYWNQWWQGMLFIQDERKKPLQLFLRELINSLDISEMERQYMSLEGATANVSSQSVKMATLFVATIPILLVYPYLQKYFSKGIMVGAVKG
jgi:putative aldouronate transport system permease protein